MERFLRPERFDIDPNSPDADKQWQHWFRTFNNFLQSLSQLEPDKLNMLINYIAPSTYGYIADSATYEDAIGILQGLYVKPKNEVFARHQLATCKQEQGQSLDQYLCVLKARAKECNFKAVTAEQNRDDAIRDAFITGLTSNDIRQRLLEQKSLDLQTAYDQARSLELAHQHSASFATISTASAVPLPPDQNTFPDEACGAISENCFFCGYKRHHRSRCPAKDATCKNCNKKGHFAKVCRSVANSNSKGRNLSSAITRGPTLATVPTTASAPSCLTKARLKQSFTSH